MQILIGLNKKYKKIQNIKKNLRKIKNQNIIK